MNVRVRPKNPEIRDRVNSMNGMFLNMAKERRMWIDPRCVELIRDFQRVQWKTDPYGNGLIALDKKDPLDSRLTSALERADKAASNSGGLRVCRLKRPSSARAWSGCSDADLSRLEQNIGRKR